MANTRELSQLASLVNVNDETKSISILANQSDAKLGIGTENPIAKVDVSGDVNVSGTITATSFYGDGSNLSNIISGVGIQSNSLSVGTGITSLNFVGVAITSITEENGVATIRFKDNDGVNGIEIIDDISQSFNGETSSFLLSSNQSPISLLNPQQLIVNLGGVVQSPGIDYTVSQSNITFTTPPQQNLTFSAVSIGSTVNLNIPADGSVTLPKIAPGILGVGIQSSSIVIGTGITTLNFIGAGNTFAINGDTVDISISGGGGGGASVSVGAEPPANPNQGDLWYSTILGRTFIYYTDDNSSQWVDAAPFNIPEPPSTPSKTSGTFTATEGQTTFNYSYSAGYIDVFLNGIRLNSSEFTASNGSSITLSSPASVGDVLDVVEYTMGIGNTGPQGPGGPLSGVTSTTSDGTYYPLIVSGVGSVSPLINENFNFNPSTGTITATAFVGNGSGLTGAGSTVADDVATDTTFYPVFTNITSGTITASKVSTTKLTFNPFMGVLSAVDFNTTSDINLKENIKTISNPIEKVLQINGVTFDWKENQQASAGIIAQDVEKVLPEVVKNNNDHKSVNYNGLIGLLVEVVKEQQEQINTLKNRIEKLEG